MQEFRKTLFGLFLGVIFLMASGCGSSGDSPTDSSESDTTLSISVALLDQEGNETRTISEGEPGTIRITVKSASGSLAVNQFLTVTTTKGSFLNSDGTAITNSNGVAEFTLVADGANGAGTIDVTAGDDSLDSPFSFQIGMPASVKLGTFVDGIFQEGILSSSIGPGEELSTGGTATITASLAYLDGDTYVPYTVSADIAFSALCESAVVDETVTSQNGQASTNYRGDGCTSGGDTVTATAVIAGVTLSASVDFSLAKPEVGSITFLSAEPSQIALAGTSNPVLPTTSVVSFVVKDEAGDPVSNESVNFSLSTSIGGISISPSTAETNSEGQVQVIVTAGSVSTSVRVRATVNDTQIATVSSNLVISTGLPDQNSFSLSIDNFSPEAWNYDGVPVNVTIRAADHFNNPVPDGTSIYFTTEGGSIDPSCSTVNGECSVEWRSQNPRPADGRVTILATALGEEAFTDANGSGRYEFSSDIFKDDMAEAFVDVNENGSRDADEEFMDYNEDFLFTEANGMYNGTLCVEGCSNELIHVRESIILAMSGSAANIQINPSEIEFENLEDFATVYLNISDYNGNSMPSETTVAITSPENATIDGDSSFTISNRVGPTSYVFFLNPTGAETQMTSSLKVKVTTPKGVISNEYILCTTPAKPSEESEE